LSAIPGPPSDFPPILLTVEYAKEQAGERSEGVEVRDGVLRISAGAPGAYKGHAASSEVFRDVVVDAQVALVEGAEDDLFGVFVRQSATSRYIAWGCSRAGRCLVASVDELPVPAVDGPLAADMRLARQLGERNRFQVVACGPSLTFVLNGMVVTGMIVDPRYKDGYAGFFLASMSEAPAVLAADWLQVRGVLP